MTNATLERTDRPASLTHFSVDVVDGEGMGVPGEGVVARYGYENDIERASWLVTDGDGRATFAEEHTLAPVSVVVESGPETTGPITPGPGERLVIER